MKGFRVVVMINPGLPDACGPDAKKKRLFQKDALVFWMEETRSYWQWFYGLPRKVSRSTSGLY